MKIIGYREPLLLLHAVYALRTVGVPANLLLIGPPGVAKTTMVKLFAASVGARFHRTVGRQDLLPEDFIAEKTVEPVDGVPSVRVNVHVRDLLASENPRPALWFFDELDKTPPRSLNALLELMEEQTLTLPDGTVHEMNFVLVAAANSRKYDRLANPLPRAVRDRFTAFWEMRYLPPEMELKVLDEALTALLHNDRAELDASQMLPIPGRQELEVAVAGAKREWGPCFVEAVSKMRRDSDIDEPPGPRAYIHATLLTGALTALGVPPEEAARMGFIAGVSGKISVYGGDPMEAAETYFENYCYSRRKQGSARGARRREFFRGR